MLQILKDKKDAALVEYNLATQAKFARDYLDGFEWCGQKLVSSQELDPLRV